MQEVYCTKCSGRQGVDALAIQVNLCLISNVWKHFIEAKLDQCKLAVVGVSAPILFLVLELIAYTSSQCQRGFYHIPQDSEDFVPNI
jgi:hypothetical protein